MNNRKIQQGKPSSKHASSTIAIGAALGNGVEVLGLADEVELGLDEAESSLGGTEGTLA